MLEYQVWRVRFSSHFMSELVFFCTSRTHQLYVDPSLWTVDRNSGKRLELSNCASSQQTLGNIDAVDTGLILSCLEKVAHAVGIGTARCSWGATDSATHLVAAELSPDCRQIPKTSHTSLVTGHRCKVLNPIISHGKTAKRRSWLGFLYRTGSLLELRQALLSVCLE